MRVSTAGFVALAALAAAACASCRAPAPGPGGPPVVVELEDRQPVRIEGSALLFQTPRKIKDDHASPPYGTRQVFEWKKTGLVWHIRLDPDRPAFVLVEFRWPYDVSADRARLALKFRLTPREMASHLAVALCDGDKVRPRVMSEVPLVRYEISRHGSWGEYVIGLGEFADKGPAAERRAAVAADKKYPFDWTDVTEIRLIARGTGRPDQDIILRDARIGRAD